MITEEEKRLLVNLAMKIDVGIVPVWAVVAKFDEDYKTACEIMKFWGEFNDMTRQVAERVGFEKCRQHLDNCYEKELTIWHWKTISYGLTRMILKLKKIWN